jgi:hypothetical protein
MASPRDDEEPVADNTAEEEPENVVNADGGEESDDYEDEFEGEEDEVGVYLTCRPFQTSSRAYRMKKRTKKTLKR